MDIIAYPERRPIVARALLPPPPYDAVLSQTGPADR
jgi:hypothetical protein